MDIEPDEDVGIMYPNVEVSKRKNIVHEPEVVYTDVLTPATMTVPAISEIEVPIPFIEIREREGNKLITVIEILSPVNKRAPGLEPYREKRQRLHDAGVHLLEIDLLRRGTRPFTWPTLPKAHYMVMLIRAGVKKTEIWTVDIKEPLPVVPVPLKAPDKDAVLNLGKALQTAYERGEYNLSIDYQKEPPPPEFSDEDKNWMRELVK